VLLHPGVLRVLQFVIADCVTVTVCVITSALSVPNQSLSLLSSEWFQRQQCVLKSLQDHNVLLQTTVLHPAQLPTTMLLMPAERVVEPGRYTLVGSLSTCLILWTICVAGSCYEYG
jgi:hypothetical protein